MRSEFASVSLVVERNECTAGFGQLSDGCLGLDQGMAVLLTGCHRRLNHAAVRRAIRRDSVGVPASQDALHFLLVASLVGDLVIQIDFEADIAERFCLADPLGAIGDGLFLGFQDLFEHFP